MDEELREIEVLVGELIARVDRCRKKSIPLKQAKDALCLARSRVRMERADLLAISKAVDSEE